MLTLHTSHRLESLADALAGVLRSSPAPPLFPETVVVQSLGMRRWLSIQLAERLGVAMNIRFPFPAEFAEKMFAEHLGESPSQVFQRDVLPWRIHAILPGLLDDPDFRELDRYAGGDPLRLWHLAAQIAATFDRYLAHRPELLLRWDRGEIGGDERWQAKLWHTVARGHLHPAAMLVGLHERSTSKGAREERGRQRARGARSPAVGQGEQLDFGLDWGVDSDVRRSRSGGRCCIFGLSSLAPAYLNLLAALADRAEIHLFLLAPTHEYWGDIRSEREQARFARWRERRGHSGEVHPFEQGHPLLASLGRVGREFHEAILDLTPAAEHEYFDAPTPATSLAQFQRDILTLAERDALPLAKGDRSIRLHNCHSPLRELEVLQDQLLDLFESDASLEPRDVLVAVPDIEIYAPFIEAVFGAPESDAVRFPYSIADRALRSESGIADAFLRLLDIAESRFAATEVLSLLDCRAIRDRFGISEGDLPLIRRWVTSTGIRWGRDAAHRESLDLPAHEENTWRFGLDRLLLGFALPGDGATLFRGVLPAPEVEGTLADTLGCVAEFYAQLSSRMLLLANPRTAAEWSRDLQELLAVFCSASDEFANDWRAVATAIASVAETVSIATRDLSSGESAIPFGVVHRHLASLLSNTDRGSGFLRGGVTFCSLRPMRAIPHRVVCLLGLDDGAFPRHERPPAFDLTAARPRPGDRTVRDDDRHLFLEAILSARDVLYVSWCGQSQHDNGALPPSVVVSELCDHLARIFTPAPAITKHRLQAFSHAYFTGGDLFSYSAENAAAAQAAANQRIEAPPFAVPLSSSVTRVSAFDLPLAALADTLTHPARFFARDCLGLRLPGDDPVPEDVEPIELDGLERYQLAARLADEHFGGADIASQFSALAATGVLPHGYAGGSEYHDAVASVHSLAQTVARVAPGPARDPLQLAAGIGDWRISATLRVITDTALLQVRPASLKSRDLLRAWLAHLVLCAAAPDTMPRRTVLVGKDSLFAYEALTAQKARDILESLIALHVRAQREPLPFFPESSLTFGEYSLNLGGRRSADPITKARHRWLGSKFSDAIPECRDAWNALVWRGVADPLGDDFQKIALAVFQPLLTHRIALPAQRRV